MSSFHKYYNLLYTGNEAQAAAPLDLHGTNSDLVKTLSKEYAYLHQEIAYQRKQIKSNNFSRICSSMIDPMKGTIDKEISRKDYIGLLQAQATKIADTINKITGSIHNMQQTEQLASEGIRVTFVESPIQNNVAYNDEGLPYLIEEKNIGLKCVFSDL
jgi:hypothetical protein